MGKANMLLRGLVKFPALKNHYAPDVCVHTDVPVFVASISTITYLNQNNTTDHNENDAMANGGISSHLTSRFLRRSKSKILCRL